MNAPTFLSLRLWAYVLCMAAWYGGLDVVEVATATSVQLCGVDVTLKVCVRMVLGLMSWLARRSTKLKSLLYSSWWPWFWYEAIAMVYVVPLRGGHHGRLNM